MNTTINREAIYAALFERLQAIPGIATSSRKLLHWADVPADEQPALFLAQGNQTATTTSGQDTVWQLRADVYLYVHTNGEAPGPVLNPLLDAICAALNATHPVTGRSMLDVPGVHYCRVEGTIETDEGTLGEQAVAIVPVVILVA